MKRYWKNNKGVTLVELMLAAIIAGVVITAAFTIMSTSLKTYNMNYNSTVDQQNLRSAMITVTKKVRNAAPGAVTITGTKVLTVGGNNFSTSSGQLMYNGQALANNISTANADYTDATHKVVQVDLTSIGGNTLSTQIRVN